MLIFSQSVWHWLTFGCTELTRLLRNGEDCGVWCGKIALDLVASLQVSRISFRALMFLAKRISQLGVLFVHYFGNP